MATKKTKKKTKKAEKPKYEQGQSGPPLDLPFEKMNQDEQDIVRGLYHHEDKATNAQLQGCISRAKRRTNLVVRNALRRLVRGNWVDVKDRGVYALTTKGKNRAATLAKDKSLGEGPAVLDADAAPRKRSKRAAKAPKAAKTSSSRRAAEPKQPKAAKSAKVKLNGALDEYSAERVAKNLLDVQNLVLAGKSLDTARIIEASSNPNIGMSDSAIAKATGLSRGFVIPRVKRLRDLVERFGSPPMPNYLDLVEVLHGNKPMPEAPKAQEDAA